VVFAADQGNREFLSALSDASESAQGISGDPVAPGVHIAQVLEDGGPPLKRYDPGHPDAGPDGFVAYPDINPISEMVDLMGATRAYGLNSSAVQAEKGMISSALEIARS
jgi:flagellar basal-body rod protein FlgC